jgi:hypothetical protein
MQRSICVFRSSENGDSISAGEDTGRDPMDTVVPKLKSGEICRIGPDDPNGAAPALDVGCAVRKCDLLVAIDFLALFVALLRFHRQRRDGPGFQPLQRDRLTGLFAIAVGIVLDAL